jgi:hypothetical protein
MLILPHGLESDYWSSADTINRLRSEDALGLVWGAAVHVLTALSQTSWQLSARLVAVLAAVMQLAQVSPQHAPCLASPTN